eukprot:1156119-Pelagomonas_calceolata.AAC.17
MNTHACQHVSIKLIHHSLGRFSAAGTSGANNTPSSLFSNNPALTMKATPVGSLQTRAWACEAGSTRTSSSASAHGAIASSTSTYGATAPITDSCTPSPPLTNPAAGTAPTPTQASRPTFPVSSKTSVALIPLSRAYRRPSCPHTAPSSRGRCRSMKAAPNGCNSLIEAAPNVQQGLPHAGTSSQCNGQARQHIIQSAPSCSDPAHVAHLHLRGLGAHRGAQACVRCCLGPMDLWEIRGLHSLLGMHKGIRLRFGAGDGVGGSNEDRSLCGAAKRVAHRCSFQKKQRPEALSRQQSVQEAQRHARQSTGGRIENRAQQLPVLPACLLPLATVVVATAIPTRYKRLGLCHRDGKACSRTGFTSLTAKFGSSACPHAQAYGCRLGALQKCMLCRSIWMSLGSFACPHAKAYEQQGHIRSFAIRLEASSFSMVPGSRPIAMLSGKSRTSEQVLP